jgi:hypothetical protein
MSYTSLNHTFTINQPSVVLNNGDKLIFRFFISSSSSANFTASLSTGNLLISSLAPQTGYATVACPVLSSTYINTGSNANEIVFTSGLSSLYNSGYTFVPNPEGFPSSSLYPIYGDVDYPFVAKIYDIVLIYLSDGTYVEYRVINAYTDSNNLVRLTLDTPLSQFAKDDLVGNGHWFRRFLLLSRIEDETNAYIIYQKRPGQTSYGFIIPQNIAPDILENIDTITKEVKQKLLAYQQGQT